MHRRRPRARRRTAQGDWLVAARVERFVEPALLLALREGRSHGYELAERLAEVIDVQRVDLGNLYRMLRSLENEGIVSSEWNDESDARVKREYELTADGASLLDAWVEGLHETQERIAAFVRRYEERRDE